MNQTRIDLQLQKYINWKR